MKPISNEVVISINSYSLYDESGVVCYEYGDMGEVTKETRIYALPFLNSPLALSTQFTYDSWGRILNITYPDNEVVNYAYDLGGQLFRFCNNGSYSYLDSVLYDRFGAKTSQKYGNGLKTNYTYDSYTRRLSQITVTDNSNNPYGDIQYGYDPAGNVTQVTSSCPWLNNQNLTETFTYDASDQLVSASETNSGSYQLAVSYGNWGKISSYDLTQTDLQSNTTTQASRSMTYPGNANNLGNSQTIFAPTTQNGDEDVDFTFGINGSLRRREVHSPTLYTEYCLFNSQANLKAYSHNGLDFAYYGYNASNTRTYKLSMLNMNQWLNGQPEPLSLQLQSAMFYPNAYINFNQNGEYTKHYYNGAERIASRLGDNSVGVSASCNDRLAFRTMQADGRARAELQELVSAGDVPVETPSMDVSDLLPIGNPDDIFYYHTNHLGSTAYVTDQSQNITQGFLYAPFGEITTEYNANFGSDIIPKYSFNAKELDEETGMYYYEARYYKPPVFTSRDPMMDQRPWLSPYHYCSNNPVGKVDPSGMLDEDNPVFTSDGTYLGCTKEGYTGMVLICDAPLNIPDYTADELLSQADGTLAFTYDDVRDRLSHDAKSNIWTHVVSQWEGKRVDDETFSMSRIKNSRIAYEKQEKTYNWCAYPADNSICSADEYGDLYETTVENVQASVIFHEWYGHLIKGYSDDNNNHSMCYTLSLQSPIYKDTTIKYKRFINKQLDYYLREELKKTINK